MWPGGSCKGVMSSLQKNLEKLQEVPGPQGLQGGEWGPVNDSSIALVCR